MKKKGTKKISFTHSMSFKFSMEIFLKSPPDSDTVPNLAHKSILVCCSERVELFTDCNWISIQALQGNGSTEQSRNYFKSSFIVWEENIKRWRNKTIFYHFPAIQIQRIYYRKSPMSILDWTFVFKMKLSENTMATVTT